MCIQGDQGGAGLPGDIGFQGDKVIVFPFFISFFPCLSSLCDHQLFWLLKPKGPPLQIALIWSTLLQLMNFGVIHNFKIYIIKISDNKNGGTGLEVGKLVFFDASLCFLKNPLSFYFRVATVCLGSLGHEGNQALW